MRSAALRSSALRPTTTGLLPPSSRVTGTRCSAAAFITCRPTEVEPVKTRWPQGWALKAAATSGPPCTTASSLGSKASATAWATSCAVRGTISLGLSTARLPAANTLASGANKVKSGAFHVPMMPTTPLGWNFTKAVAPNWSNGATLARGWSGIQASKWSRAAFSAPSEPSTSFIMENSTGRPPKSASIAAHRASQCFTSRSITRCRR